VQRCRGIVAGVLTPPGHFNRLVEREVARLRGIKSLYSESVYPAAEFSAADGGDTRRPLKARDDAERRLGDLYARCVLRRSMRCPGSPGRPRMLLLRLLLPAVALMLLAAHFHRAGWLAAAVLSVALTALLAVPRPWAARTLQAALVLGALEWLRTLAAFAAARISLGQPYLRLALILGAVAAVTIAAAWIFQHRSLRTRFRLAPPPG
jgi:hypothetical protein